MKKFAERLRALRLEKNMSCLALSKVIGVSDSTIFYWENDKQDIKSEYLLRLAVYFGVTTDYLLGHENQN